MTQDRITTPPRRAVAAAALLAVAVALTACGGSGKSSAAGAAAATSTSGGSSAATGMTTAGAASSASAGAAATGSAIPNLGSGSFCDEAKREQQQESQSIQAFTGGDASNLKTIVEQAAAELPVFVSKAPAEIKGAVQVIATAEEKLLTQLKASNFDLSSIASAATSLNTPSFAQATTAIENYLQKSCGINITSAPTS